MRARAETRRLDILRAAARVFRRQGFAATGMREIAAEAGLSPGNLYHYFSGKDDLLYFCQDRSLNLLLDSVVDLLNREPAAHGRLFRMICAHVEILLDAMEGSAAHLELGALPEDRRAALIEKRDRYEASLKQVLADGMEQGEFAEADPGVLAKTILGAMNWPAFWFRNDGGRTPEDLGVAIATYLTRGAMVRPADLDPFTITRLRAGSGARR